MNRPVGITITVVLLILGGLFCLLVGTGILLSLCTPEMQETAVCLDSSILVHAVILFTAALFGLLALWQFLTGFGLWRLKRWARVSLLSFSGVLVCFQGLSLLMVFFLPLPADDPALTPEMVSMARLILIPFYLVPLAVGVWWLVYFSRARTKALFLNPAEIAAESARPLSIVIIGWLVATTPVFWPFAVSWKWPAVFLWIVVTGWAAVMITTAWCAWMLYAGVGLLRWKRSGYHASFWLFVFGAVNSAAFWLGPGAEEKTRRLYHDFYIPGMQGLAPDAAMPSPLVSVLSALLAAGIPLYFLMTRKEKFMALAAERDAADRTVSHRE